MTPEDARRLVDELCRLPHETEWVEFKHNNPMEIGDYLSALSNSACLHEKPKGYLVFGVEDGTHRVVGTTFKPRKEKVGNEELENWLTHNLEPRIHFRIHEFDYEAGKPVVLFEVDATVNTPVRFKDTAFIRIGSYKKKLADHPEHARRIWAKLAGADWSAGVCEKATLVDLQPEAIAKARVEFRRKNPKLAAELDQWDDVTFLNKAKVLIGSKVTRTAILLLGREESSHHLSPAVAQLSWILKDERNREKDYQHFGPPFILNIEALFARIRNLTYRYLPDGTLFPEEVTQYDPWVIREALHNCIAHQDYERRGRVVVVERPDELLFSNEGRFIPGSVEEVIRQDAPQKVYRNPFLAQAMVNLNLIDTIGGGIKKMYLTQRSRRFPLPTFDLTKPDEVAVRIPGKILDENYTRMLIRSPDLELETVMLLDRVQKHMPIAKEDHRVLKAAKLVEGRYPNLFIAAHVAASVGKKAQYIRNRGFDDAHYGRMVLAYLHKYGSAARKEIDDLLLDKLSEVLSPSQRKVKINMLLSRTLSRNQGLIRNDGNRARPSWVLTEKGIKQQAEEALKKAEINPQGLE